MKQIFVNLKRFDVPKNLGGICNLDNPKKWIEWVMDESIKLGLGKLKGIGVTYLLPEALIIPAMEKINTYSEDERETINIGCQGVFREDVRPGGNFGAFTTNFPAAAAKAIGCSWTIIGHSEERKDKLGIISAYEPQFMQTEDLRKKASKAVNAIINQEVQCAFNAGINVLLCVGETAEEKGEGSFEEQKQRIKDVLKEQLEIGLKGFDGNDINNSVVIGYEPIWAIGPGKIPPDAEYISFVSKYIKETFKELYNKDVTVVYGGGLKEENAGMISKIDTIGGGLVALTKFTGDIAFEPEGLKNIINKYLEE